MNCHLSIPAPPPPPAVRRAAFSPPHTHTHQGPCQHCREAAQPEHRKSSVPGGTSPEEAATRFALDPGRAGPLFPAAAAPPPFRCCSLCARRGARQPRGPVPPSPLPSLPPSRLASAGGGGGGGGAHRGAGPATWAAGRGGGGFLGCGRRRSRALLPSARSLAPSFPRRHRGQHRGGSGSGTRRSAQGPRRRGARGAMAGPPSPSSSSSSSPGGLREETARLLADYLEHRLQGSSGGGGGGGALPAPSREAETLRRVADELERRERPFFRRVGGAAAAAAAGGGGEAAGARLARVAAQMEAEGGLNWGRVVALVVFAGNLAAALAERGAEREETRRALAEALAAYLADEKREWMEAHGGWDGFCHFFNKHGSDAADQNSSLSNAIMAAAGFGLAGLAFLLAVR
uniref:Bcl-2-like protein 10 n=1 Tax=Pogona vitticeps TaxID=103695 RepID=A0ABM5EY65_9SAUR